MFQVSCMLHVVYTQCSVLCMYDVNLKFPSAFIYYICLFRSYILMARLPWHQEHVLPAQRSTSQRTHGTHWPLKGRDLCLHGQTVWWDIQRVFRQLCTSWRRRTTWHVLVGSCYAMTRVWQDVFMLWNMFGRTCLCYETCLAGRVYAMKRVNGLNFVWQSIYIACTISYIVLLQCIKSHSPI